MTTESHNAEATPPAAEPQTNWPRAYALLLGWLVVQIVAYAAVTRFYA